MICFLPSVDVPVHAAACRPWSHPGDAGSRYNRQVCLKDYIWEEKAKDVARVTICTCAGIPASYITLYGK